MKKILFSLALGTTALVSCNQDLLDIEQKGVITTESFYKTDEDAESALVAAYAYSAQYYANNTADCGWNDSPFLNFIYLGDDVVAAGQNKTDNAGQNELHSFRFDTNNGHLSGAFKSFYRSTYACNLVIGNFEPESATKKRCIAEARIIRAFNHFMLAQGWGAVPIVENVLEGADKPGNSESREQVFEWVVKECQEAMTDLTERQGPDDRLGAVKVTKGFAQALQGKALLYLKKYTEAANVLRQVITSGNYELVPSDQMKTIFHVSGDACSESIFEFNLVYDAGIGGYGNKTTRNQNILWNFRSDKIKLPTGEGTEVVNNGWGALLPSKKFIDALIANDGMESARRKAWILSYDELLYDQPYNSDADCPTLEAKMADPNRGAYTADGVYGCSGYFQWKRAYRKEDDNGNGSGSSNMQNMALMRLPEVLLMYAECQAQTGDADGSGLAALNKIQDRAQANHRSTACTMDEVKNERFLELFMEGIRFFDLVRWGDAPKELGNQGSYFPNYCDAMFTKGEAKHRGYLEDSDAGWCKAAYGDRIGFKTGKHELFPYPYSETSINPNIVQNPGWATSAE